MARRSAFDTACSSTLIGSRWLTPLRLSTRRSPRASNATRSMTSTTKSGTSTGRPRSTHASCCVICHAEVDGSRVVGEDLRPDPVLEGRDDLAAGRVVLGIRREAEHHVERQPHRIALQLHVPFLHDVEQSDLDLRAQVGQLVDREDAAIGAGQQPEVHRQLVGEQVPAAGGLDRVHVADDVGDGDVRCRELLDEALVALEPRDRRAVAQLRDPSRARISRADGTGSSFTSLPATMGMRSSSSEVSARRIRVLAWPRSPSRMKSCRASSALTMRGTMVSS